MPDQIYSTDTMEKENCEERRITYVLSALIGPTFVYLSPTFLIQDESGISLKLQLYAMNWQSVLILGLLLRSMVHFFRALITIEGFSIYIFDMS